MATAMGRGGSYLIFCLFLSVFVVQIHAAAKNQGDALDLLYKAKFFGKSTAGEGSQFFLQKTVLPIHANDTAPVEVYDQSGLKDHDRIGSLPGQPAGVVLSQYGGYVTVDRTAGRALYYYFVEAKSNKESLPLLLWLNGGPGCSSLGYGAMAEHGPFRVLSDGKTLFENEFAWHNAANVLFLESPAGVGFSYSNSTADYSRNGDQHTAQDNYRFLVNWLERFPEYKTRDFYIAGESYAGHYVPQLAHTILSHNKAGGNTIVNLKGIIIGNAVINDRTDQMGMFSYLVSHGMTTDSTFEEIKKNCNSFHVKEQSEQCQAAIRDAYRDIMGINIYNIYYPLCPDNDNALTAKPKRGTVMDYDPCTDAYTLAYLNTPEVQKAMHANVTGLSHDWAACSHVIERWTDSADTVLPLLSESMSNGLRVWVFSGDMDGRVPVTSTKYSIDAMNLTVKRPWQPWIIGGEVGGYAEIYEEGLTLATVRGAGHEVPSYQPVRALTLISHFLQGSSLPFQKLLF